MKLINFISHDIWRMTEQELSKTRRLMYRFVKIVVLAVRAFITERLNVKASALTYSILFAIVPMFALIVAIGRGFGVEALIEKSLEESFFAQSNMIPTVMGFVKRYLETTQGGVFIGIGLIILLVSVMNFFIQVELAFNGIWQVKKSRKVVSQFTMYFSAMLIIPFFMVLSSGLSIYINTILGNTVFYDILSPFVQFSVRLAPYFVNWIVFTIMYLVIPNTKVNFKDALIAGVLAGSAFQLFQVLYINGQVLLSRYDVVYGSFAAIPLLLLWLQISCLIVLLGAEISYASQNIQNFEYEADSKNISTRYKNFLTLFIAWLVVKQFEKQLPALSSNQIALEQKIPIRLVNQLVSMLVEAGVFVEVFNETNRIKTFQPAIDINQLNVSVLYEKIESFGTEHFLENKNVVLDDFWHKTQSMNAVDRYVSAKTLIKDI
jgi:membrane protein